MAYLYRRFLRPEEKQEQGLISASLDSPNLRFAGPRFACRLTEQQQNQEPGQRRGRYLEATSVALFLRQRRIKNRLAAPVVSARTRARRGPKTLLPNEKREHCVSVRLNAAELAVLDSRRKKMRAGAWLRAAALETPPVIIPEINKQAWAALGNAASNLNQIARKLNSDGDLDIIKISKELAAFRFALLGIRGDAK